MPLSVLCSTVPSPGYYCIKIQIQCRPDNQTFSQWLENNWGFDTCSVAMQYSKNIAIFKMSSNFRLYRGNVFQLNTPMLLIIYPCSTGGSIHKIDRRIRSRFVHCRFVSMMPTPVLFTVFSFLLRVVDGTGTAMFMAVSYTLLTQSYPEKKGTIVVSDLP